MISYFFITLISKLSHVLIMNQITEGNLYGECQLNNPKNWL